MVGRILGIGLAGAASWLIYQLRRKRRARRRIELEKERLDNLLDQALMDTFPASDPLALTNPYR